VPVPAFPFVGRAAELATLRSALDRAERGEGGLVLLGAEAGGGKTRVVRELAVEAAERGVLVLYGVSDAVVSTPYQPLREWLSFLGRSLEPEVLDACLGERRELVARLAPELAREPAGPDVDRYALQSAVCEVLRQVSRTRPVVLVAEDVHWADAETLPLLRRLAATAPEARMLVLATYRDRGEEHRAAFTETLAELTRLDGLTRISPARLTTDEVRAFIGASTDAEATGELAGAIAELTGGTPLLVCELWRDLRESGAVEVSDAGVQLTRPLAELRGPERLRDVVRHRLARLAPETAATLELAAVGGPRFELRALAHAAGRERSAVAVDEATSQGLLEELPETVPAYRFTHELVRRAVYDRITGVRRAELHLRFGEALEHVYATDPTPVLPELAHHFTLAVAVAGPARAVDYNLRAAAAAVATSAFDEGAARLSAALELGIDDPRERARVQLELSYLLHQLGRGPEADARLTDSLAAATGADERGVAAHALVQRWFQRFADPRLDLDEMCLALEGAIRTFEELGDHRGLAMARRNLAIATSRARRGSGLELLERALVDANASGDPNTRRTVIGTLLNTITMGSTPVGEGIARCEELLRESGDDAVLDATIRRFLSLLLAMAARFDEAREELRRSSLVLDGLRHLTSSWVYGPVVAEARALIGDRAGAERELLATIESFQALGDAAIDERAMNAAGLLAALYCDEGRWDEAAEWLAFGEGIPLAPSTGTATRLLVTQARVAAHRGDHAEALALAHRALDGAPSARVVWSALAEVHHAAGAAAEADAALAEAIRLYEAKGNVAAARQLRARLT
jgi:tetratricopeptide (TPR) repeat protein